MHRDHSGHSHLDSLWCLVVALAGSACGSGSGNKPQGEDSSTQSPVGQDTGASAKPADATMAADVAKAADTSGIQLTCQQLLDGCSCTQAQPQVNNVATCDTNSVVTGADEQGLCCQGTVFCTCKAYVCKSDPSSQDCMCANVISFGLEYDSYTPVPTCPVVAGQHCCRDYTAPSCTCSSQACLASEGEVDSCAPATVAKCDTGTSTPRCK
jgi:hypothetical protein